MLARQARVTLNEWRNIYPPLFSLLSGPVLIGFVVLPLAFVTQFTARLHDVIRSEMYAHLHT